MPFVWSPIGVAVALTATTVFAASKSGPGQPLTSDAAAYAASADNPIDYSESPSPASSAILLSDSAGPSPVSTAAAAVPTSAVVAKPDSYGLSPEAAGYSPARAETTTEIPQAVPTTPANSAQPETTPQEAAGQQAAPADYDDGIIRYEQTKNAEINGPPIGSLNDFMSEGDITSPLGIEVREDKRRLKRGGEAEGLLIVDVVAGSAAAHAGLHPYHRVMRDALETAAVAGALFCPPVVLLVPVFDQVRLGETYDLIIGVDGSRVTNFLDFEERLRDVQAGEIVYFSIIRNGKRMQIPVPVPDNLAGPTF
jgi:hypothetical protein